MGKVATFMSHKKACKSHLFLSPFLCMTRTRQMLQISPSFTPSPSKPSQITILPRFSGLLPIQAWCHNSQVPCRAAVLRGHIRGTLPSFKSQALLLFGFDTRDSKYSPPSTLPIGMHASILPSLNVGCEAPALVQCSKKPAKSEVR